MTNGRGNICRRNHQESVGTSNPSCFSQSTPWLTRNGLLDALVAGSVELDPAHEPSVGIAARPEDRDLLEVVPPDLLKHGATDDVTDIRGSPTSFAHCGHSRQLNFTANPETKF